LGSTLGSLLKEHILCPMTAEFRDALARWYSAAVAAVQPERVFRRYARCSDGVFEFVRDTRRVQLSLPWRGGRLRVIGIGKAALGTARGFRASLRAAGHDINDGLLIVRDPPIESTAEPWKILFGNHPYPGEDSTRAARSLLEFIGEPRSDDCFVLLLSGGASALCALPAPGVTLEDKRRATMALMHSGASIAEINRLRQQLSAIKGGRLGARLAPASFATLAISDVPGDDPLVIGSAPTWSEELARRGSQYAVVATLDDALDAAAGAAQTEGFDAVPLGRCLYGSVEHETMRMIKEIERYRLKSHRHRPGVLIAGGEPLVAVRGSGRGGRAQELALRLGISLGAGGGETQVDRITGLVAGTDGSDGPTTAAGAFFDATTRARAERVGIDLALTLETNDSGSALQTLDDLFVTGPTGTNVADILMVVMPSR